MNTTLRRYNRVCEEEARHEHILEQIRTDVVQSMRLRQNGVFDDLRSRGDASVARLAELRKDREKLEHSIAKDFRTGRPTS